MSLTSDECPAQNEEDASIRPFLVTVDVVALTIRDGVLTVLLVRRAWPPFEGQWALPGGFVRTEVNELGCVHHEDLYDAAHRELEEETGLRAVARPLLGQIYLEQLGTYGRPDRDPRGRIISVAYLAFAPHMPDPRPGGDVSAAAWVSLARLGLRHTSQYPAVQGEDTAHRLAFDHAEILADGLERARSKLEYTPLATRFLKGSFTIPELRGVYEAVWGERVHRGNFHRKVTSVPGFVESMETATERGGRRGGRRARVYRAGSAQLLHPALLRPSRGADRTLKGLSEPA